MSTKHVRTASDLVRFKCLLKIECGLCGNSVTVTGLQVLQASKTDNFRRLQARLKCSACGAKQAKLTVLSPPPRRD